MKVLITGGTGFLGGALARRLQAQGVEVTVTGRNVEIGRQFEQQGMRFVRAELSDGSAMQQVCANQDIVYHCGALSSPWGRWADFYAANVVGTKHIIQGCFRHGVKRLIHVSTPGVYFNGQPRLNLTEDAPLPRQQTNHYTQTKYMAEQLVDAAYADGLPVITLRPRAIFGPRDTTIFPRLIRAIQSGRLRVIGDGQTLTDLTYIDNVVDALLLCQHSDGATLGRKYNITNGEPIQIWAMINHLCQRLGYPPPTGQVPKWVAYAAATTLEAGYKLARPHQEPPLTRYTVGLFSTSLTLNIEAARQVLGYEPRIRLDDGIENVIADWVNVHQGNNRV